MLSLLIIGSILAFLNFLYNYNNHWLFLIFSAITAALAVLTKSSATIILPFIGFLCVIDGFQKIRNSTRGWVSETWEQFKHLGVAWGSWLLIFMVAFVLIWPGMWVNPAKMLFDVYGNAFSYAFQGYNLEYAESLETPETDLEEPIPSEDPRILNYAYEIPWRTTPVVWVGLFLTIVLILSHKLTQPPGMKQILIIFLILALLFIVMMSLAKGRLTARYIMVTFASLGLVASLGIGFFLLKIQHKLSSRYRLMIPAITFMGFLTIQAICALKFYPYYFNYSNPILEIVDEGIQTPVLGYGEGLELAAQYIAQKPGATDFTVMSWYGIGPFSFFFSGQTENMYPGAAWTPDLIERLERSDFLVVYQYHQQQRNMPAKLLQDIANAKSEYTIWLNGVEYVRIYPVSDLPDAVFVPDQLEAP
jgi:hypothetical protein